MNREEFLKRLREGLDRLPPDELENVLAYYSEIFLDAGEENEREVLLSLGNVEDIIRQTYVENGIDPDGRPDYYVGEHFEEVDRSGKNKYSNAHSKYGYNNSDSRTKYNEQPTPPKTGGTSSILPKLLLLVITFPIWLPILIVCCVLTFLFVFLGGVLAFVLGIVGVSLAFCGLPIIISAPPLGLTVLGIGLILAGIFALIAIPSFKSAFRGLAGLVRKFVNWVRSVIFSEEVR